MKKTMVALAMILTMSSITAFAGIADSNPFAIKGHGDVNEKVLNAFKQEFTDAAEVKWSAGVNYYKAEFIFNNQYISAFYSTTGELYGVTRHISSLDLPLNLLLSLKKDYSSFWITDLFEMAKKDGTSYYITLEDADTKVVLKASGSDEWTTYKKTKKS